MKALKYIILTIFTLIGIAYIWSHLDVLEKLQAISISDVLMLFCVCFAFFLATGFTFYLLVSFLSIKLSVLETIGLTFLTSFGNYLGPARPGAVLKAIYLKGEKGLSYTRFTLVLAANSFLLLFVSGTTGVVLFFVMWADLTPMPIIVLAICLAMVGISLIPLFFLSSRVQRNGKVWDFLNKVIEGVEIIKGQRQRIFFVVFSIIIQYIIGAVLMVIAYGALGQNISILTALIIGVFTSILNLITITPNNLGIQEILTAYLFTISGMDFTLGLLGISLIRAAHIVLTFTFTPVVSYFMLKSADMPFSAILPALKRDQK